ncbi:hypothetical protein [Natronorubrum thiooxidans]|uniref:DUF7978 domain-containing protein n=1 Tax=Natronorubrum thiooxidans TaxID=308853 RepID=A0A1N7GEF5_9EURY|nr:hypothetical protein [Natronorubrum thiooxidans]SIS10949.1 hypothetical protein SAMN05421752_111137 [Natronorubrum thiooxidans]
MASQQTAPNDNAVSRGSSVAASAGLGVLAAAIGYLVTYVLIVSEVREAFGDDVADWKGVAWYFYNAHMVDVEASGAFGSFGGSSTVDFIAQSSASGADLLYVIPPLVLLTIGAILAVQWDVTDLGDAVVVGAPVTLGYAVVMALGALVAESSTEIEVFGVAATGSIAPEFAPALVLGGVLYPLVFATAGAVLAAVFNAR